MQNSHTTVYFRRPFDVPRPAPVLGLEMRVDYDDGFVAYVSGVEVALLSWDLLARLSAGLALAVVGTALAVGGA